MIGFFAGIFVGALGMVMALALIGSKDIREGKTLLKEIDKLVDDRKLKFHSRIRDFVYINGYKYTIIYMADINKIAVMEGVKVVLSHKILEKENEKIASKIRQQFYTEMNDVVILNGIKYSKNIVGGSVNTNIGSNMSVPNSSKRTLEKDPATKKIVQTVFKLDDILDKISTSGYKSLSDEEKEWLDKESKKDN